MKKRELEHWLCGPDERVPAPTEIADLLGVALATIADTTLLRTAERLHAVRFIVAVLRDVFPNDSDVRSWLHVRRAQLNGRRALDLILAGRMALVEELAVHEWHRQMAPLIEGAPAAPSVADRLTAPQAANI